MQNASIFPILCTVIAHKITHIFLLQTELTRHPVNSEDSFIYLFQAFINLIIMQSGVGWNLK